MGGGSWGGLAGGGGCPFGGGMDGFRLPVGVVNAKVSFGNC